MVNIVPGGDNGANNLDGTNDADLIYGFDPEGQQGQVSRIDATRVASGLKQPMFAGTGDLHRLFIVEKGGAIKILNLDTGTVLATPFLDVSSDISAAGEGGLLGLAFDPNFAQNHFFYINAINQNGDTEICRYTVSANDPNKAVPGTEKLIIRIDQPAGLNNHKAGWLGFGPDGYLYAALGDGGGGGDPSNNEQNLNSLLGKILRLDVHGDGFPDSTSRNYAIPSDNPFVSGAGADEIWALGLRNPFRDSFDRPLGTFFIADVGQASFEEVNIGQIGANFGWDTFEGPDNFDPTPLGGGTLTQPIHFYDHSVGHSITGGYVYRGSSEGLQGHYFFADFVNEKVFTLHFNGTSWDATERPAKSGPMSGISTGSRLSARTARAISMQSISTARCFGYRRQSFRRIRATY
jgi:glucose/arabinose dehydrogenase